MIGLAITSLGKCNLTMARDRFLKMQESHPIQACEIHFEAALYPAAVFPWEAAGHPAVANLRHAVEVLGVHLPFYELNPLARNPRVARLACALYEESLAVAGACGADYVVFHCRGVREGAARTEQLRHWSEVVAPLTEQATRDGMTFCLENADDMRFWPDLITIAQDHPSIQFCLDTGHLYERVSPITGPGRHLLKINDRCSPLPLLIKSGLPVSTYGSVPGTAAALESRLACIHLHNHNGRAAHQPLTSGVIHPADIRLLCQQYAHVPLIIEAEYDAAVIAAIEKDLEFLEGAFI